MSTKARCIALVSVILCIAHRGATATDYDVSNLRALVDPTTAPVIVVNRYIDQWESPAKLRLDAYIRNRSSLPVSVRVFLSVDYRTSEHTMKILDQPPIAVGILPVNAVERVSLLIDRPSDFLFDRSSLKVVIQDASTLETLFMERISAWFYHKDGHDKSPQSPSPLWLPNPATTATTMELVAVCTGTVNWRNRVHPTPGVPIPLAAGQSVAGSVGVEQLLPNEGVDLPNGTNSLITVFGIVDGEIVTLSTHPQVVDDTAPTLVSAQMSGSTFTLVASKVFSELHLAQLFVSFDLGATWYVRQLRRTSGDFLSNTTFAALLSDLPTGVAVTLRGAVRDMNGNYVYSGTVTYTP